MNADFIKPAAEAKQKATLVYKGGMGNVCVMHVYLIAHGRKKYAQYQSAVFCHYIEKGKRKAKGFIQDYSPYLVILEGWQDIQSQDMFRPAEIRANGTMVSVGKFASCDDGWQKEFEAETELKNIIADYRGVNTLQSLDLIAA